MELSLYWITELIIKRYGKYFMESIPTRNIKVVGKSAILKRYGS